MPPAGGGAGALPTCLSFFSDLMPDVQTDAAAAPGTPRAGAPMRVWRLYYRLIAGHRGAFWLAMAFLLAGIVGHLVFVVAAGRLVDSTLDALGFGISADRGREPIGIDEMGVFLLLTMVVTLVCVFIDMRGFIVLGERAAARLRSDLFGHLIQLPMAFFESTRVGELSSRLLADVALLQETWTNDLRTFVKNAMMLLGGVGLLFLLSVKLGGLVLLTVPPIVLVSVWSGSRIRRESAEVQERLSHSSTIVEEVLTAIRTVKTFANEGHEARRFGASMEAFLRPALRVAGHRAAYVCLIMLVLFASIIGLMWFGSRQIASRHLTPGDFTGFMSALVLAATAGGLLAELVARFQRMSGATERILSLLEEATEDGGQAGAGSAAMAVIPEGRLVGRIGFAGVSFRYPMRTEAVVLREFDLRIDPGERVALVGPSGAGKSTVAALLFRLFDPESGRVEIGGREARDYPLGWLRGQMALVPQEVLLFGGSIAENVAYGRPGASREEVVAAARRANAMEFIDRLPDGLDTRVGDRGVQLSGGQRQRLAIARAILKDPAILVLDEATSSLDPENERLVQEALEELMRGRTTLVIAHRLRTVRACDRIVVMRDGRVIESGRHEELLAAGGAYRNLCEAEKTAGGFD